MLAEWGDVARPDMTFSVAKSFLALLAGLAVGDGLIKDLDDKAGPSALDDGFASEQNKDITWRHLLTQTSEWQGTLFGKEDRIDHNRVVGLAVAEAPKGTRRQLKKPGSFYEYNDVRVNRLSLSLLQLFKEPLPSVLKRRIMDPIGASPDWKWDGYRNSTVTIDGKPMISVPGGGHWGGGIVISARDLALMGLLVAQGGAWDGKQLLPTGWTDELVKPCPVAPFYGLMWWLNTDKRQFAAASERSYFALGWGSHIVWIDPDNDLVTVLRWIDRKQAPGFVERLLGALSQMSLDYSAVPRMPDGRTAAEHIAAVAATSRAVRVPMGNGGKMMWHVWGENSGKPILLLFHGGSGSWIHWIRNVQPLSQHFTVYAADMPGLGDSDPPDDVRDVWSVTRCVETAMKALLPADKTFAITGFSFGGMVAGHIATLFEPRIRRIVMVGAGRAQGDAQARAEAAQAFARDAGRDAGRRGAAQSRDPDAARSRQGRRRGDPHADHEHHARQDAQPRHGAGLQAQRSAAAGEDAAQRHLGRVRFDHLSAHPGTNRSVPCVAAGLRDERHSRVRGTGLPTRRPRRSIRS